MSTFVWATPRKAFEYYLDRAQRTPADLWQATHAGHIRVSIMDVEFSGEQVRALLNLLHKDVPESERKYELPTWMGVSVDDVERTLCGASLPERRRGRPRKSGPQANADYRIAVEVSKLIGSGQAKSVAEAAGILIDTGRVSGWSHESNLKRVQRAYASLFRHD